MVMRTPINPPDTPRPVGGYSQAFAVTGASTLLYVSGQIPEQPDGTIPEEFGEQCRLAWSNVTASLRAADFAIGDLVKVTTFLTDHRYAEANRAIRQEFLGDHRPASTVIVTGTVDPRWLLEIEAIAAR